MTFANRVAALCAVLPFLLLASACSDSPGPLEDASGKKVLNTSHGPVTVEISQGGLEKAELVDIPSAAPQNFDYPVGFIAVDIGGLNPGASVKLTITLPSTVQPDTFVKCFSGTCAPFTGTTVIGQTVILTLVDGGAGDDDGLENGIIRDPGAPARLPTQADPDQDGVPGASDNCPSVANSDQADTDDDDTGDACDPDDDNDGIADADDAFPTNSAESSDTDGDGIGNNADFDDDNDGLNDADEVAAGTDPLHADTDGDGVGDAGDNCRTAPNADQLDSDSDSSGDVCDPDDDNDGVADGTDAFPTDPFESSDADRDGVGDNADADDDNDGVADESDNCRFLVNAHQVDVDADGIGDACDATLACPPVGTTIAAEWTGHLDLAANVSGTGDFGGPIGTPPIIGERTEIVASDVDIAPFVIPAGCGVTLASVEISWTNPVEDIDLYVVGKDDQAGSDSATVTNPEIAHLPNPAGAYEAHVVGFTNLGTDYRGKITLVAVRGTGPACSDGVDNDSDGKIDYPNDAGCLTSADTDESGELQSACDAAYAGLATANPALAPTIPIGSEATLLLSFAGDDGRDAAAALLRRPGLLNSTERASLHVYRNLPILLFQTSPVTQVLLDDLKRSLRQFRLVSIWNDHSLPLMLDTSTGYIESPVAVQTFNVTGQGIGVAIIDSGIDTTQGDFVNAKDNRKFIGPVAIATPYGDTSSGHGTHVAGIVGGTGASSDGRWKGVAPGATLLGYGSGDGRNILLASAISGYDRMMDPAIMAAHNPRVTNNSFGGPGQFNRADPLMIAVKRAYDRGIISVFATGNDGPNSLSSYAGPCSISVANGDRNGQLNSSSSTAAENDARVPTVTAPGTSITAPRALTGAITPPRTDNPRYSTISGTSMASPHIAGVIALMQEARLDRDLRPLRLEEVISIFGATSREMFDSAGNKYGPHEVGFGYVDALGAVASAAGEPRPPTNNSITVVDHSQPASFSGSAAQTAIGVCLGCEFEGSVAYSGKHLFRIPANGIQYADISATLRWSNPAEKLNLRLRAPDGRVATTVSAFDDTRIIDAVTSVESMRSVSLANPEPGVYELRVSDLVSVSTPYTIDVAVSCPVGGCNLDPDGDGLNNDVDLDDDGDGVNDTEDSFPYDRTESVDTDGDGAGNNADTDDDGDGVSDSAEAVAGTDPLDRDSDDDGTEDGNDAFPLNASEWLDSDSDGVGNNADTDDDNDGILDVSDPCPLNPDAGCSVVAGPSQVVVSVLDTGILPYHDFYFEGSPIYPAGSPPSAVTPQVLAAFGINDAHQLQLTRTGNFAADYAADAAIWSNIKRGELYWFRGTNIIAASFDTEPGRRRILPDPGDASGEHGVGTSAAVLTANPEAIILFAEFGASIGDAEAETLGFRHPLVDIVSTSYGYAVPLVGVGLPLPFITESFAAVIDEGRLHFSSAANSPDPFTPESGGAGPWWSIGVAGIEEGSSNGRTTVSGYFPDFVSDFTQRLPYCFDCEKDYEDYVAGTSFATPRSAGVASKILLEARRALVHSGGITTVDGKRVMASGNGRSISNWQVRRALESAAYIDLLADYDPIEAIFDLGAHPVLGPAPWLTVGWGNLSALTEKAVVVEGLARLGFGTPTRTKPVRFCDFQTANIQRRKLYWDAPGPGWLLNSYDTPENDPFIYCNGTLQ